MPNPLRNALPTGAALGAAFRLSLPREAMRGRDGARAGAASGASLDFLDFRDYHPGDDLRRLDWGVYARTDREVVKLYREEVLPRLDIVLDTSRSMDLPGTGKAYAALSLCAALAAAAANAGCAATLWTAGAAVERVEGSDPHLWPPPAFDSPLPPAEGLRRERNRFHRHGIRMLVSDLLFPEEPAALLKPLSDGAAAVFVAQLLAPEELDPADIGPRRLYDVESGATLDVVLDEAALATYRAALASHRARWQEACRAHGATLVLFDALDEAPPPHVPDNSSLFSRHSSLVTHHSLLVSPLVRAGLLEPL